MLRNSTILFFLKCLSFFLAVYALFSAGFTHNTVAYCDNAQSGLSVVNDNLACYKYGLPIMLSLILIFIYVCSSYVRGVDKYLDYQLTLFLSLTFSCYTIYRCVYHLYVDLSVFTFILLVKTAFVYYKNGDAIFKYAATSEHEKKSGAALRLALQYELTHFNLRVCWSYLQLAVMQGYFLLVILLTKPFVLYDIAILREFIFFLLTCALILTSLGLATTWAKDFFSGDPIYLGVLLLCLCAAPLLFYCAMLFYSMVSCWLYGIVGIILFFGSQFLLYVLNVRSRFEVDTTFLSSFKRFVVTLQSPFVASCIILYTLSYCLEPTFKNNNLLFLKLILVFFTIVLLITLYTALCTYLAYLRDFLTTLSRIEPTILYISLLLFAYILSVLFVDIFLTTAPTSAVCISFVSTRSLLGGDDKKDEVKDRVGSKVADELISLTGTDISKETVQDAVVIFGVAVGTLVLGAAGTLATRRLDKGLKFLEQAQKAREKYVTDVSIVQQLYILSITKDTGFNPETFPLAPHNASFVKTDLFVEKTVDSLHAMRHVNDLFAKKAINGDAMLTPVEWFLRLYLGPRYKLTSIFESVGVDVPAEIEQRAIEEVALFSSADNTNYAVTNPITDIHGKPIFLKSPVRPGSDIVDRQLKGEGAGADSVPPGDVPML